MYGGHHDNTGATVQVQLVRNTFNESWGFRIQGGTDFRQPLSVKKVTPNTPAANRLHAGDAIIAITGYATKDLTHTQATQMIRQCGNSLDMTLQKGLYRQIKPAGPIKFSAGTAAGFAKGKGY